jgi:predicted ATPase
LRIISHIQNVVPQFGDFAPPPPQRGEVQQIRLDWTDTSGTDYRFDPSQLSDGAIRFIALATLLLQPAELLPSLLVIDEPELGLHPSAISELAAMVRYASHDTQIILATQSSRLVDEFEPEQIIVAELDKVKNRSVFKKLDADELQEWLERYTLSELWEKNVLGGKP